ncbi:MAG: hypothetical protein AAGJ19_11705 [Myxococcota bacterium]
MGSILSLLMGLATAQGEGSEGAEITTVHPIVFVESERQGEAYEAYRRIRSDRPLELKLSAPGRVFVSVRTLIGSRSGPHQLQFEVDGETVKEAQVSPRRDDLARFVETVPGRLPGEKRTFLVPVEASADSFPRRLTVWLVKGKEILLSPRYASPLELELDEAGTSTAP